jgi:sugar/nucleoside kinase (ribokinase family)
MRENNMRSFDIYAYGMVSTSTLYKLDGKFSYPEADHYAEFSAWYPMTGGEAANSAIVLAKLGASIRLDGNWLGTLNPGERTLEILGGFGIDTSRLLLKENYKGVEELVIADDRTRTVFGTYVKLFSAGPEWNEPCREDIEAAKVICMDPFFREESLAVSRICTELNKPYITVDCKYDDEIAQNAAAVVIAGEYRHGTYPEVGIEDLFAKYLESTHGLVIFTSGGKDILYGRRGEEVKHFQPYQIQTVDTTGAGDTFRAGIVYGFLQNWPAETTIHFAVALAAYVCETFPGVLKCPNYDELMRYIEKNGRKLI